jgi:hypothetical protein
LVHPHFAVDDAPLLCCARTDRVVDADQPAGAKGQIPRVEARCERGRVTQTQTAQPGADFHSAPRGRPVRKPGFRGEVSAKQVRNASGFRHQTPTPGPLPYSVRTSRLIEDRSRRDCAVLGSLFEPVLNGRADVSSSK